MLQIFHTVCQSMESNSSELYTVIELLEEMRKLADNPCDVYSVKHLKELLKLHYGEDTIYGLLVFVVEKICFKSIAQGSSISGPRAKSGPQRLNNWPAEQHQRKIFIFLYFTLFFYK